MSATTPTVAELQALIVTLQAQVSALAAAAPAPAATTAVVFADAPQSLNSDDLIDYSTKKGESIYKEGIKALEDKALTEGFGMTPGQTVVFIEALTRRATAMGWMLAPCKSPPTTMLTAKPLMSLNAKAKSMRPPSREVANVSARRGRGTQRVEPSKTTR
jgi:hypothetical protein